MTARRPGDAPPPIHSDAGHRVITAELVRCTLGRPGPQRPELHVGFARVAAAMNRIGLALSDAGRAAAEVAARMQKLGLVYQQNNDRRYPR